MSGPIEIVSGPIEEIWLVEEDAAGTRLDSHVAEHLDQPRNQVHRWIDDQRVTVNGRAAKASRKLNTGDEIQAEPPEEVPDAGLEPEPGEVAVLHEDEDVVVINKPTDIAIHPGAGRQTGTLAHHLLHRYPEIAGIGGPGRPGIVHRLDVGTTGVVVVARSERAYRQLSEAFSSRSIEKTYLAIAYGTPREPTGTIDLPIGRDANDRKRMAVHRAGRAAVTHYACRASAHGISWIEIGLETGRTHQIRVHLKAVKHPLVGDPVYGEARWRALEARYRRLLRLFPRPALHAWRLAFVHPGTGEKVRFEAPVPEDMAQLWRQVAGESLS